MKTLIALLLLSPAAFAGDAYVEWVTPTTYLDGTEVQPGDITAITLQWGNCLNGAIVTVAGEIVDPTGLATSATVHDLPSGEYCFQISATANGEPLQGAVTTVFRIPLLTNNTTAYTIGKDGAIYRMLPVGTVPLNTPCRAAVKIAGLYQIPNDQVTTASTAAWFFGKCL